ncbi:MAG TPA: toll/interleukin-1 receptor domain-containing protein, partial [Stellaceae bacterium]|nr:toll/interleukin-1 receptor domain-containing protein [Stellaceae bacterium]
MRRWFLSYNSQDFTLAQELEAALKRREPQAQVFFSSKSLRAGGFWMPELAREIAESTAFVLLIGKGGLGPWQGIEYYEAFDRRVKDPGYPVVLVLLEGETAPGLPFLRQLHWIVSADPTAEHDLAQLFEASSGGGGRPKELWRHTAPYRGLAAMTEGDADFFFGRVKETQQAIEALATQPEKLHLLLGNSGVGKSSLAQAGVLATLMRQGWPEAAETPGGWPQALHDSRHWCYLKLRPGSEPVRALVEPFLRLWQLDAVDPGRARLLEDWVSALKAGKLGLRNLMDATQARYRDELSLPEPPAFLLYVDQGEELYARGEAAERRRFSEHLARGLGDPRLRMMLSLRADFLGEVQKDEPIYEVHRLINVTPLRAPQLREVVGRPPALLSARFASEGLAEDIAARAAEESVQDAGALPLLSYLLDDMWREMVRRGDGVLHLPAASLDLGGVLVRRANAFL